MVADWSLEVQVIPHGRRFVLVAPCVTYSAMTVKKVQRFPVSGFGAFSQRIHNLDHDILWC